MSLEPLPSPGTWQCKKKNPSDYTFEKWSWKRTLDAVWICEVQMLSFHKVTFVWSPGRFLLTDVSLSDFVTYFGGFSCLSRNEHKKPLRRHRYRILKERELWQGVTGVEVSLSVAWSRAVFWGEVIWPPAKTTSLVKTPMVSGQMPWTSSLGVGRQGLTNLSP